MKIQHFIRGAAPTIGLLNIQSFRRIYHRLYRGKKHSNIIIRHCILDVCDEKNIMYIFEIIFFSAHSKSPYKYYLQIDTCVYMERYLRRL